MGLDGEQTRAIMLIMVALPATSRRKAICTAPPLSRCPVLTWFTTSLLIRSSVGSAVRLSTNWPR